jgi:YidC/Oxa1 family membrane protein insertase
MFFAIDAAFHVFHNFGVAILIVTLAIKIAFFPLANRSYVSMAKMKALQPRAQAIRDHYPDDKAIQQKLMMELYKRAKINPASGCLPMLLQVPIFFSLYKVLFTTIEMRHAPFFGWIHDLSAPDPTNLFNLFGLLPIDPTQLPLIGPHLAIGVWPLVMGATMWLQMRLNPTSVDPSQRAIFNWLPVVFMLTLANFPAGLVIYWTWNNLLSIIQQTVIMHRQGTKIGLLDNLRIPFAKRSTGR